MKYIGRYKAYDGNRKVCDKAFVACIIKQKHMPFIQNTIPCITIFENKPVHGEIGV